MTHLNANQLAFILDCEVQDAREKMVYAYCKSQGVSVPKSRHKTDDEYQEVLQDKLGLPALQQMVDDIENNYLNRSATKKYILQDYPQKSVSEIIKKGSKNRLQIPSVLKSMLSKKVVDEIYFEWQKRYPQYA